jgi:hypothetical protein
MRQVVGKDSSLALIVLAIAFKEALNKGCNPPPNQDTAKDLDFCPVANPFMQVESGRRGRTVAS